MAALTFRQVADIYTRQASAYALRHFHSAESATEQAVTYNLKADEAGEPA